MRKGSSIREDRLIQKKRQDSYRPLRKFPEPTLCTKCKAVFVDGRWTWSEPPKEANETICPACRRILDKYPAGYVEIRGSFFVQHRDEILGLINNVEAQEKNEHPLERIMNIKEEKSGLMITTTGVHVARRIGEALSRSYKGDFSFQYGDGEKTIQVHWER